MEAIYDLAVATTPEFVRENIKLRENFASNKIDLTEVQRMSGSERKNLLLSYGVESSQLLYFLRAMHSILAKRPGDHIAIHDYPWHSMVSANAWDPLRRHLSLVPPIPSCFQSTSSARVGTPRQAANSPERRYDSPFLGIRNQGSTCYLNSLLQALFHLSAFRKTIYSVPQAVESPSSKGHQSVVGALQRLFYCLQTADRAVSTTDLTASFGWSSTDSFIQHDIHELTRILLDNLEDKLKKNNLPNEILALFGGELESFVSVPAANYCGSTKEVILDIQLVVKDMKTIYESFDHLTAVEILDGSNKYCLERNGEKSYHRAEKGVRIKKVPQVLLLHLARFDFDPTKGDMCKVFTRWEFYERIDLRRYGVPPEDSVYKLHSVLVHSGPDAARGHYYSFVRCGNFWYSFNDDHVTKVSPFDVFGANFGGSRLNYWGSELPLTANAYMLVYIKVQCWPQLVSTMSSEEIPEWLSLLMEREKVEEERRQREREEDHLYARISIITAEDLVEHPELLSEPYPRLKFPEHRTARVLLTSNAKQALSEFIQHAFDVPIEEQFLWCHNVQPGHWIALGKEITDQTVSNLPLAANRCCVLLTPKSEIKLQGSVAPPLLLTHHKYYDPEELSIRYIAPILFGGIACHITSVDSKICELLLLDKGTPLTVCEEKPLNKFSSAVLPATGAVYVWQKVLDDSQSQRVLYPTLESFAHFLIDRVPVDIHELVPPAYPLVKSTTLARRLSYGELQRYVAKLVGEKDYDKIRFSRYNPDTKAPFFAKQKKKDGTVLETLLLSDRYPDRLNRLMYFEIAKYNVTEIESMNPLQFEYFNDHVKCISSHYVLMPQPQNFTLRELLVTCANEAKVDLEQQWRLLDVWKGVIYNVYYSSDRCPETAFEESAEYRLESCPTKLPNVPAEEQLLIDFCHISPRTQNCKVVGHGDPFSMYVSLKDLWPAVAVRIAEKLEIPLPTIEVWKPVLHNAGAVVDIKGDIPIGKQIKDFCPLSNFATTSRGAYIGLEHAPLKTRQHKRDEGNGLRIYN